MVLFSHGSWVWLQHDEDAYIPVQMVQQLGATIIAKAKTGETYELDANCEYTSASLDSLSAVSNLVRMSELSEAAILHNLKLRYDVNLIYTSIAAILVSINPFKMLPIYSPAIMREYRDKLSRHEDVAPHIYALADQAFKCLSSDRADQAVIISGESGAGKTEATKLVLQYLAEMSGQSSMIEQQLLESNPIVEAFGNSKTLRNNNSSRFGKWLKIQFNDRYHIVGANISQYLLEKSRIVTLGAGERNYHLFYQICAGLSTGERHRFHIDDACTYRILAMGNTLEIDGVEDGEEWKVTKQAMDVLKFTQKDIDNIISVAAAILHLGNIEFESVGEACRVKNSEVLSIAASLLNVDVALLTAALISQRKQMGKEMILTVRTQAAAEASRDALMKKVYSNLFNWLIAYINDKLNENCTNAVCNLGVLDIFGFESFTVNRFEQFLINFANEKMQSHFNTHIFTMEQQEYANEKIDVQHVGFIDNSICLELIENGKLSILGMIDEELKLPKGSDDNFLEKLHQQHAAHKHYVKPKTAIPVFSVVHYAGSVTYTVEGFYDKNRDSLESNISEVIQSSSNPFIAALIPKDIVNATLGSQFKTSLNLLMDGLNKTNPHFIRCIKSNNMKVADTFESVFVLRQLRYLGIREVVSTRQLGYPVRKSHAEFVKRYRGLQSSAIPRPNNDKDAAVAILNGLTAQIAASDWRVGLTKVFLKHQASTKLELLREKKFTAVSIYLQSLVRTKQWRKRFLQVKQAVINLKQVMTGKDPKAIDDAITHYQSLRFKTDSALIQKAIQIRNRLRDQADALSALTSAVRTRDVALLAAAIAAAQACSLEHALLAQAQTQLADIQQYNQLIKQSLASRDVNLLRQASEKAKQHNLNGPEEKQVHALLQALEEEARVKKNLDDAMKSRDLDALKKALQVAMAAKSGNMVGTALESALAAGLSNDPLVQSALSLVGTLEKEVHVFKLAEELKKAIESDDLLILQRTVKIALEKGFDKHALTKQAQDLIALKQEQQTKIELLLQACKSKNLQALDLALQEAGKAELSNAPQFIDAQQLRNDLSSLFTSLSAAVAAKDVSSLDSLLSRAVVLGLSDSLPALKQARTTRDALIADQDINQTLTQAMESKNLTVIQTALQRAKKQSSFDPNNQIFIQAQKLYDELSADKDTQKLEEANANASVAQARRKEVRRSLIMTGQTSLLQQQEIKEKEEEKVLLDVDSKHYQNEKFKLFNYADLRSANDYSSGNKALKTTMLRYTKDVIPKSITQLNDDSKLNGRAIELFKMIQGFCLDRHYSFPDSLVIELSTDILLWPLLRDEVYVQLMKQLSFNDGGSESEMRGWMLLCLVAEIVPPSTQFVNFVLHFIARFNDEVKEEEEDMNRKPSEQVKAYANYAMHKLKSTVKSFTFRPPAPDSAEFTQALASKDNGQPIACLAAFSHLLNVAHVAEFRERTMQSTQVVITLPDFSRISVLSHPWQNNADIVVASLDAIQFPWRSTQQEDKYEESRVFSLFEARGQSFMCCPSTHNVMDVQALWSKIERKEAQKQKKGFFSRLFGSKEEKSPDTDDWLQNPGVRRILLRQRIIQPSQISSYATLHQHFLFLQIQREIAAGWHAISEEQARKLAFIATRLTASSTPLGSQAAAATSDLSDEFAALQLDGAPTFLKLDSKKFAAKVAGSSDVPADQCSLSAWFEHAQSLATFGCLFFPLERVADPAVPIKWKPQVVVALHRGGMLILDDKTKTVLDTYPLLSILGWSQTPVRFHSKVKLNATIGAGISTVTHRFNTFNPKLGAEMCDTLMMFANEIMRMMKSNK